MALVVLSQPPEKASLVGCRPRALPSLSHPSAASTAAEALDAGSVDFLDGELGRYLGRLDASTPAARFFLTGPAARWTMGPK
jgi:hypothetical protein